MTASHHQAGRPAEGWRAARRAGSPSRRSAGASAALAATLCGGQRRGVSARCRGARAGVERERARGEAGGVRLDLVAPRCSATLAPRRPRCPAAKPRAAASAGPLARTGGNTRDESGGGEGTSDHDGGVQFVSSAAVTSSLLIDYLISQSVRVDLSNHRLCAEPIQSDVVCMPHN